MPEKIEKTCGFCAMEKFDNRPTNSVGSSRIRVRWLLHYWEEAEEYIMGKKYEVLIFQKVYWENMMRFFEGIKIIDLCDADWLEGKPVFEFIDLADATVTSTQALADYIQKLRPNALVKCIPDRVYLPEMVPIKTKHEGFLRKLAWFGYSHNAQYLLSTFDDIISHNLELTVISNNPYDVPLAYRGRLKLENVPYDYNTLGKELMKYDAVLMPAPFGDEKSRYKSNNKVLQAWALGMPVITLPQDLERFNDPLERKKESELRLKEIKEKWDCRFSVDEYKDLIKEIKERKKHG
jgi:hypothetical protein